MSSAIPRIALVGCGNRGREVYGGWLAAHPEAGRVVAVADPDPGRRQAAGEQHGVPPDRRFRSAAALLDEPRMADACVLATPDAAHVDPALAALARGYHLLLEKPVATHAEDLDRLAVAAREAAAAGVTVTVAHVLRYTPFFQAIHRVLRGGRLGRLRRILHAEQVGHWHFAHSFVRGNWRRRDQAAPMVLAKACHDLDLLVWLAGSPVEALSSRGGRTWFRPENRPDGAPERCTDGCPVEDTCPYAAPRIYLGRFGGRPGWPNSVLTPEPGPQTLRRALEEGPYGRCVYACDNDVADQQGVELEFAGGLHASLSISAFTEENTRRVELQGTEGLLRGVLETGVLELTTFCTGETEPVPLEAAGPGAHGGGDDALMRDFTRRLAARRRGEEVPDAPTALAESLESHRLAFLADRSRRAGGGVQRPADLSG